MKNYKLKKPIEFDGQKINDFNFDFEGMTRKDYRRCIREAKVRNKNDVSAVPLFSETFRLVFAAVAAGVPTEVMFSLYPKDIISIGDEIFSFFFGTDNKDINFEEDDNEETNIYKLKDPIKFNGESITEFIFDFDSVNYLQYKQCERDVKKITSKGVVGVTPADDENFQLCFAAKATKADSKLMFELSLRDAFNIGIKVRNFLSAGDSDEEEEAWQELIVTTLTPKHKENIKTVEN